MARRSHPDQSLNNCGSLIAAMLAAAKFFYRRFAPNPIASLREHDHSSFKAGADPVGARYPKVSCRRKRHRTPAGEETWLL
jgi:hypothetical protein